jgi:hypothetical protein
MLSTKITGARIVPNGCPQCGGALHIRKNQRVCINCGYENIQFDNSGLDLYPAMSQQHLQRFLAVCRVGKARHEVARVRGNLF